MDPHALPILLRHWPERGASDKDEARRLVRLAARHGYQIDPYVPRRQMRRAISGMMHREAAVPGLFSRMYGQDLRANATKLRPSVLVPITFDGYQTTMWIDTVRRTNFRGKNTFLDIRCKINTEDIPIMLQSESKCECLYCGTRPSGSETNCRSCGAQLPDC